MMKINHQFDWLWNESFCMQLQLLTRRRCCLLTLTLKGYSRALPGFKRLNELVAQSNAKTSLQTPMQKKCCVLFTVHQWPSAFSLAVAKCVEGEVNSASLPPPDKWMWKVMSRGGKVQDMKEVHLCSPQAARPLDLWLGGGHTDHRQPAGVVASLQSRSLAPHYNNSREVEEG